MCSQLEIQRLLVSDLGLHVLQCCWRPRLFLFLFLYPFFIGLLFCSLWFGKIDFHQTILVSKAINCIGGEWWRIFLSEALGCELWGTRVVERIEMKDLKSQSQHAGRVQPWELLRQSVTATVIKRPESHPLSVKSVLPGTYIKMCHHLYPLPSPKTLWIWTCSEFLCQQQAPLIFPAFKKHTKCEAYKCLLVG